MKRSALSIFILACGIAAACALYGVASQAEADAERANSRISTTIAR